MTQSSMHSVAALKSQPQPQPRRKRGANREALMEAALSLVGEGRHFASLGIREVARQANVVPTAFYRHFKSMDDLGLQLVDELGLVLRRMMREAREQAPHAERLMADSINLFMDQVLTNPAFFRFMMQGLAGETRTIREGIRSEMRFFVHELMNDLRAMNQLAQVTESDLELICDLLTRTVAFSLTDILGVRPGDDQRMDQIRHRTLRHLQLIFLGAQQWRSKPSHS
ncbi:TetR family transcriptional regulator [Hydrocarboniclastica marina]|nr:TetR family transcriptional regulator [Hydrocarboniclastica marina]